MRLHRTASEKTIELGPHDGPWRRRRAAALGAAGVAVALAFGVLTLSDDQPPALMTIPPGPGSVLLRAEMAVDRLAAALEAHEPVEIQDAAIELRARLQPLSPQERQAVEQDAVHLLEQADRTIGAVPPPPATPTTPRSVPGTSSTTTTPAPTTTEPPVTTTTEPAPTTTTTEPAPTTTTTEPPVTTTTEPPTTTEEVTPPVP